MVNSQGKWKVSILTPQARGSYRIFITNQQEIKTIENYCCPIKILQRHKIRADFICEVSPFSLDFSRQTIKSNHGQKYTF